MLDIGCGTGAHALAVAARVAPGEVSALDISEPLLTRARERAAIEGLPVTTTLADAQTAELPGGFDAATSRFGVMFFQDPAAAFANIAGAVRPGGRMLFAAWGPISLNPWWRLPIAIASERLGKPPPSVPNAPGPMGLADRDYALSQLRAAGLKGATVTPKTIALGRIGDAAFLAALSLRIGPAARIMRLLEGTSADAEAIQDGLAKAYSDYEDSDGLGIPATLNIIDVPLP